DVPAFLDEAGDRPFFLWVGFTDPHRPYDSAPAVHDPSEVNVPPYLIDEPETRADLARYYDEIHRMDGQIGRFVDVLEERGLREHTLVIFLSDNGMPFPGAKGTVYDEGIRTPLIFTWPGRIEAGTTYGGLVSVVDLAPTILEIAGMETPTEMQGSSIAPILEDRDVEGRTYVFSERNWHNCDEHIRGVRSERFKFVRNAYTELPHGTPADASTSPTWYALKDAQRAGTLTAEQARIFAAPRPAVELYDLENDPWEMVNLAGRAEYEDVARELADVLDEWIRATDDFPPSERRRLDNTDRVTGVKFTMENPPFTDRH
ncbi:MAG: sulfatase, partial [Rhodothermales bacterium]